MKTNKDHQMIQCGIIGYGKMGRIRAQAITEDGRGRVTRCFDPTAVDLPAGAEASKSAEALIADAAVEAVFICTPNSLNKPLTMAGLAAGKHVFCEKPPAFTASEVEEIIDLEKSSGKRLMYGFNHRHHASIQKMKALVDEGEMGRILWMRGRYGKEVDDNFFQGWRARPELAGGGIMLDQGIHMLDLMIYLSGGFDDVQAMVSNLFWKTLGIEDNAFVNLRNRHTGICASLHSTMTQWRYLFSLEVFLERGALILNGLKTSTGVYGDEDLAIKRNQSPSAAASFQTEERLLYRTDTSWLSEVSHFLDSIGNGKPIAQGTSLDALNVMRIMDQIYAQRLQEEGLL